MGDILYLKAATLPNCNSMKKVYLLILFFSGYRGLVSAQDSNSLTVDMLVVRVARQLSVYPQEKVHLHTDRSVYSAGDTLWFKPYLVHATFHTPLRLSRYLYTELISPKDSVVKRVMLRTDSNLLRGYIPLPEHLADGVYTLRAYTAYMAAGNQDYLFQRSIRIISPQWAGINTRVTTVFGKGEKTELFMKFGRPGPFTPQHAQLSLKKEGTTTLKTGKGALVTAFTPKEREQNSSMLLSFTDSMGERYSKYFALSTDKEDYAVSFYPEGGYLLSGTPCRVAFKALGSSGQPEDISLDITDSKSNVLSTGHTLHQGMGSFVFSPADSGRYRARCVNQYGMTKVFDLPEVQSAGYGLKVAVEDTRVEVSLLAATRAPEVPLYLVAHVRGAIVYAGWWKEKTKPFVFDKNLLPSGVVQFLLLDKDMSPVSERLAFCYKDKTVISRFQTDKAEYGKREQVNARLTVTGADNQPVNGDLSVSVTDSLSSADTTCNILTTLLLTSELKGYIQTPSFYFGKDTLAEKALDLLMLTQGWRRYNLPEIIKGHPALPAKTPETGQSIAGKVIGGIFSGPSNRYLVNLSAIGFNYSAVTKVGRDRRFSFDHIEFPEGTGFEVQALKTQGENKGETRVFNIDQGSFPEVKEAVPQERMKETVADTATLPLNPQDYQEEDGMRSYLLKPVEVKTTYWGSADYGRYSTMEISRLPYKDVRGLLKYMGLTTSQEGLIEYIYYHGARVAIFVDAALCFEDGAVLDLRLSDIAEIVFIKEVANEKIDDLIESDFGLGNVRIDKEMNKNFKSHFYGNYKQKGDSISVLNITTKERFDSRNFGYGSLMDRKPSESRLTVFPLGFQDPVEFYSPQYDTPEKRKDPAPDLRKTIYWKPDLKTDSTGTASFSFYSADRPGTYSVVIEGVSDKGDIIYNVRKITIR
jgi:hypothetical protein